MKLNVLGRKKHKCSQNSHSIVLFSLKNMSFLKDQQGSVDRLGNQAHNGGGPRNTERPEG